MKKNILIFCTVLTTFSLMAFGFMNWSGQANIDLIYNVDHRYGRTITKENLHKAKSIIDIFPKKATQSVESYQVVEVVIHPDVKKISEIGDSDVLNTAQKELLQSADYSTNFYISTNCRSKNADTGELEADSLVYWMTIVPEKEAEYTDGHDALIEYLKENSKEKTAIIKQDKLQPGKVSFTVTKEGTISNVKLTSTSGYPSVDEALIELVSKIPGKWDPAKNSKGKKVDQELVFFFGLQGC